MDPHRSSPNITNEIQREHEPTSSKLLDELLESTLSQRGKSLSDDEWELLRSVLIKSDLSQVEFLEASTRVIEAFLFKRFPKTLANQNNLRRMSENIAQTLSGDPTSRQRLVEFLQHLRASNTGT
jgi:hypothetical protein